MFDQNHYVPVLKWRQGEYQALVKLDPAIKDWITPLFEIPKETWDFEKQAPTKDLDDHLAPFGKRLKAKWGIRRCFVDSCYLSNDSTIASGTHHLDHIFKAIFSDFRTAALFLPNGLVGPISSVYRSIKVDSVMSDIMRSS
jgi:hypothetical protein